MRIVGTTQLEIVQGDLVDQDVDAIVNAANTSLLGGGGVDGAIHRAAGPQLLLACMKLLGCATGNAKITPGFRLRARHVIHAVGPVYRGRPEDATLLASAYQRSLDLAEEHQLRSLAFSALSTGVYGYPLDAAAAIAIDTVARHAQGHTTVQLVRFVAWTADVQQALEQALADWQAAT